MVACLAYKACWPIRADDCVSWNWRVFVRGLMVGDGIPPDEDNGKIAVLTRRIQGEDDPCGLSLRCVPG